MKQEDFMCIVTLVLALLVALLINIFYKNRIKYVDAQCPVCESSEVLDLGRDLEGNQQARCFECRAAFTILDR